MKKERQALTLENAVRIASAVNRGKIVCCIVHDEAEELTAKFLGWRDDYSALPPAKTCPALLEIFLEHFGPHSSCPLVGPLVEERPGWYVH